MVEILLNLLKQKDKSNDGINVVLDNIGVTGFKYTQKISPKNSGNKIYANDYTSSCHCAADGCYCAPF